MEEMEKKIFVLIGAPGSGKGTQAELLAKKFNLYHLETSKLGEEKINNLELVKNDPEIREAKRLYDKGELFPPPWTTKLVLEKIRELVQENKGVVFSGSPRTIFEAENEFPEFERIYGKENIYIFEIVLSEEESVKRNSVRKICKASRHSIPATLPEFKNITVCPEDGSEIITRTLDKPELIRERYKVYLKETKPISDFLKNLGYEAKQIDGEQPIEKIYEDILKNV